MAMQKGKSELLAKLGGKGIQAFEQHKSDETKFGFSGLPAGIENGVAQLNSCKFGVYKEGDLKGQYFWMASGIVKAPKIHETVPIEGSRTQIGPEPVCDTPKKTGDKARKTVSDHLAWIMNEFRKLGVDTSSLTDAGQLEAVAVALEKAKPYFKFRTWKGKKATTGIYKDREPQVQHQWNGVCQFSDNGTPASHTEDDSAQADDIAASETEGEETAAETVDLTETDMGELVELAGNGDDAAIEEISKRALEAGIEQDAIEGAENWGSVADMIEAAGSAAEEEPEAAEEAAPEPPKKKEMYKYLVLGPNGKPLVDPRTKKAKKACECEIIAVDIKGRTCTLKNHDDGKSVYKSVPWDQLIAIDS